MRKILRIADHKPLSSLSGSTTCKYLLHDFDSRISLCESFVSEKCNISCKTLWLTICRFSSMKRLQIEASSHLQQKRKRSTTLPKLSKFSKLYAHKTQHGSTLISLASTFLFSKAAFTRQTKVVKLVLANSSWCV